MKRTLQFITGLILCGSVSLSAQQASMPQGPVSMASQKTLGTPEASTLRDANPGQNVQMTTCTDKITFVDRHPQVPQYTQVGGSLGWWSTFQTYPNYTGSVTEAYATLRRCGATTNHMQLYIYKLNSSHQPTGSPLDSVNVNVTSTSFQEYGGVLSTPANITQYGFAVAVWTQFAFQSDSVEVAVNTDPDYNALNYYYYQTLQNAYTALSENSDFLERAKISYTAPTETETATPNSGCAGDLINFSLSETGTPAWYTAVWASPNAPTYSWTFGDAGTSTSAAPTHSYASSGSYTVTGTKTNPGWTTTCPAAPATATVTINGTLPSVSIAASANPVCPTGTCNFSATPTNGGTTPSYVWKINGIQVGTGVAYSGSSWNAGDVVTCEMVSNAACAPSSPVVSNSIIMYLQPLIFSSFSYSATGLAVSFTSTAAGAVTYAWNFGDLGTSASPTPVHNYASPGVYTVDLTVTNSCGQQTVSSINITVSSSGNSSGSNTGVLEKELVVNVNAFPNPVNNDLSINYSINHTTDVTIEVLNTLGQVIATQGIATTSEGTAHVSMENMASGLYFVRFTAGENNVQMMRVVHE